MFKKLFTAPIKFYQKHVSPGLGSNCRFYPTCSQYAIEAIEEWGVIAGSALALWRLLRCNPFCKCGYDPVPTKKKGKHTK
ncbi:MAG: membrane protein insertion efficiency factor YidD [Eubacteriales bacterium]